MDILFYIVITVYIIDIIFLFYFGVHCYAMVYLYLKNRQRCVIEPEEITNLEKNFKSWPKVTIQLPIFNEYYVVDRLIESVVAIDYPKSKLEIQVLDDSTDSTKEKAAELVAQYKKKGFDIKHIHRTDRTGHKAGALKEALEVAKGEFIGVFDADFIPAVDFLRKAIPYFYEDPKIGMVQTRWGHVNEDYSVLTKAQSIGIDGHFVIEQVARNGGKLWMNFNGTAGVWRKECIYDSGNWQSDTLTEDFDLSYRAELKGWRFKYLSDVVNPAELPATVPAYKSQQFRWCKGSIQTGVKLIPTILKSKESWKVKLEAVTHLTNYSVHPLMVLNILATLPILLMHDQFVQVSTATIFGAAFFLSIGTFGPIAMYLVSQYALYKKWGNRLKWMPVLTMIGTGVAINNTKAWLEAIIGKKSSFIRTPKLRIESKKDKVATRTLYRQIRFDMVSILEFLMGVYVVITIFFAIQTEKYIVIPFLALYAAGFFYISMYSVFEGIKNFFEQRKLKAAGNAR